MRRIAKTTLDFLVIGAQKAGTTSLYEYLKRHPELYLPPDKEAPYFSHDSVRRRGWDRYVDRVFAGADPECKWGTVTTHYMAGGIYDAAGTPGERRHDYDICTIPLRIRERLPAVRLVAILRDPVERAMSHHQMQKMRGLEQRTFPDAVAALLEPARLRQSREWPDDRNSYVTWGEYGRILAGYFQVFGPEQILVIFTEQLERAPKETLDLVHEFIGVSTSRMPDNLGVRYRESRSGRRWNRLNPDAFQVAATGNRGARAVWQRLPERTRRAVDTRFARAAYQIELWNQKGIPSVTGEESEMLSVLRRHYEQDARALVEMLGRDVPWQALVSPR